MPDEQPIPAEEIAAFYVRQLELRLDQAAIEKATEVLKARADAAQDEFAALFTARGLDPADFEVNLKTGKLTPATKKNAPEGPQTPEPTKEG